LLLGETDHFILGVIRNLCALSGTISYERCNNNSDHSPQRRHGFAQHDASPSEFINFIIHPAGFLAAPAA
jgi:hypothetical protein